MEQELVRFLWGSNVNIHREAVYWLTLENKDDLNKWEDTLCT